MKVVNLGKPGLFLEGQNQHSCMICGAELGYRTGTLIFMCKLVVGKLLVVCRKHARESETKALHSVYGTESILFINKRFLNISNFFIGTDYVLKCLYAVRSKKR